MKPNLYNPCTKQSNDNKIDQSFGLAAKLPYEIILASASPRRQELLMQAGFTFQVIPSKKEEIITKSVPSQVVMELAAQKALDIFASNKDKLVIGADTIVSIDDQILGKPADIHAAKEMLLQLSGRTHQVYTGVALYFQDMASDTTQEKIFFEKTDVTFYEMTEAEIDAYIATKDPLDKAGSYGIQGPCAIHIKGIAGDYNNVVGLPLSRLYQELKPVFSNTMGMII